MINKLGSDSHTATSSSFKFSPPLCVHYYSVSNLVNFSASPRVMVKSTRNMVIVLSGESSRILSVSIKCKEYSEAPQMLCS